MSNARLAIALLLVLTLAGCSQPNKANTDLRKRNQELQAKVEELTRVNEQLRSQARSLESDRGTLATLPQDRLEQLFTVGGIEFGRLTGREGDNLKVYLTPTDDDGSAFKAAGGVRVEAFNLNGGEQVRVGTWTFPIDEAKKCWQSGALFSGYVLTCDLIDADAKPADDADLLIKATYEDGLTGRSFEATRKLE